MQLGDLEKRIFSVTTDSFNDLALEIFSYQYANCAPYKEFVDYLGVNPEKIKNSDSIPHIPIELYKTKVFYNAKADAEAVFLSSGTTGQLQSKHCVKDLSLYEKSFSLAFQHFYGNVDDYRILALLPSYLEREGSSLVYMMNRLIEKSNDPDSGFFLNNRDKLVSLLKRKTSKKTLLVGVSFALLDLAETYDLKLENTIVMETGGMKGRRKEMIREELHGILKNAFGVDEIHSEYGMTELLSQAYSTGSGKFECPPWMKIRVRDTNDPGALVGEGKTGGLNITDLANIHSCSFIATSDLGRSLADGRIEIIGRFDYSDMRGCNLMVAD
ncbi:MAG: acyl transferase [Cryomorphaceae bacterium]